ncbi:MAG TPA: NAD-dependent succinate-semialdehyde dehydrogenase [bacterium]|nr:NAD-dependent succinate-semialdehyde dehydrogenase [bacterium]
MMLQAVNPADNTVIAEYPVDDFSTVEMHIGTAAHRFETWRLEPIEHRAALIRKAADILRGKAGEFALLMAGEMGKPVREGRAEVEKCAWVCEYYADHAAGFLMDHPVSTGMRKSYVTYQPIGAVLAVMPWNFPFWQVFRFAAPNLTAGNTALLKHASNVPGCARAIETVFADAGFPDGVFRTLMIPGTRVAEVIGDPRVAAVTLTGSTPAGRAVAEAAGRHLKKTVLELGGSDPYLILEDADLDLAVEACVTSRLLNTGQSCIAAKRFILVESIADVFMERFIDAMASRRFGDPIDSGADIGPMARRDLRDDLHQQVLESIRRGARLRLGGEIPDLTGAWYPPTILDRVAPGMPAYRDEFFGPVAAVIAARIANDTSFGLGAAVFTKDVERGERIARNALHAGCCAVNDFVRSDPRLPFGGVGESGYGRELGVHGIHEFMNIKTVSVR